METPIRIDWIVYVASRLETFRVSMVVGTFSDESETIRITKKAISDFKPTFQKCGLDLTVTALDRLEAKLKAGGRKKSELATDAGNVLQRLADELPQKKFYVTTRDISSFPKHPFGEVVSAAFPETAKDIEDAQRCLWNEHGTATVFHLMRVMERFVKLLGKKLRAPVVVEQSNWAQITSQLDKAMRALPAKTVAQRTRRDSLAATLAHLNAVRIAWRNAVMHPKAHYSVEEARQIFEQVKIFSLSMIPAEKS